MYNGGARWLGREGESRWGFYEVVTFKLRTEGQQGIIQVKSERKCSFRDNNTCKGPEVRRVVVSEELGC